jgi:hypothetical protein
MKHSNFENEIYYTKPPSTDWFATLLAVAFTLFMVWVLVEYAIGADELLAWVEAL